MIKTHDFPEISLVFDGPTSQNPRQGQLIISDSQKVKKRYSVCLTDLPCVVEVQKTLDNKNYYKSGDIGQMLLVDYPDKDFDSYDEKKQKKLKKDFQYDDNFNSINGLTPSTTNIRKRKFRKRPDISVEDIREAEDEINRIKNGGVSSQNEIIEKIKIEDVDEIYECNDGYTVLTFKDKNKDPIRSGPPDVPIPNEILRKIQEKKEGEKLKRRNVQQSQKLETSSPFGQDVVQSPLSSPRKTDNQDTDSIMEDELDKEIEMGLQDNMDIENNSTTENEQNLLMKKSKTDLEEKRKNALDQFNFKKKELEGEKNTTRKKKIEHRYGRFKRKNRRI